VTIVSNSDKGGLSGPDSIGYSKRLTLKDSTRLMFLFSIAGNAWGGENLECDTKAPGCSKLCTNEFFPFSPIALWKLQMLGVSLPIIIFVSYSGWKLERIKISLKKKYAAYEKSDSKIKLEEEIASKKVKLDELKLSLKNTKIKTYRELPEMSNSQRKKKLAAIKQTEKYLEDQQAKISIQLEQINEPLNTSFNVNDPEMMFYFPRIIFYYFVQVIVRTGVEIFFNHGFFLLYSDYFFNIMPEQHICQIDLPCNGKVSCYIDKPKSKTFVLLAMCLFSIITIVTGFIELGHIGLGKLYEVFKNWGVDVTADFKVGKAEQMFHMDKQVEGGFVNFQGTRIDHVRDEIGEDEDNQFIGI